MQEQVMQGKPGWASRSSSNATKGIIPYANGASDIDTAEYLARMAGTSNIPSNTVVPQGRRRDERELMRVFRSFDTNFDGVLTYDKFRQAMRYLGIEKTHGTAAIDDMARKLDRSGTGVIHYRDAVDMLQVESRRGTTAAETHISAKPVLDGRQASSSRKHEKLVGPLGAVGSVSAP